MSDKDPEIPIKAGELLEQGYFYYPMPDPYNGEMLHIIKSQTFGGQIYRMIGNSFGSVVEEVHKTIIKKEATE